MKTPHENLNNGCVGIQIHLIEFIFRLDQELQNFSLYFCFANNNWLFDSLDKKKKKEEERLAVTQNVEQTKLRLWRMLNIIPRFWGRLK